MLNGVPVAGVAGAGTSSAVAVTTVYVLTSGSGDSYRIERVYLDSDQAYRFAQDYNGMPRWYRSRWRNGRSVPARRPGRPLLATRSGGRRGPASNRRGELRHTRDASGARNWNPPTRWTGDALPNTKVACRKLTGYPRPQVAGLSNEKQLMETLGTRLSRSGPSWRGFRRNSFRDFVRRVERNGHGDSTLPPDGS